MRVSSALHARQLPPSPPPPQMAITGGHTECVRLLLGCPRLAVDGRGCLEPPLHTACRMGKGEAVQLLLGDARVQQHVNAKDLSAAGGPGGLVRLALCFWVLLLLRGLWRAHARAHTHTHMYTLNRWMHTHIHTHAHMRAQTHVHVHIRAHTHTPMRTPQATHPCTGRASAATCARCRHCLSWRQQTSTRRTGSKWVLAGRGHD